MHKNRPSKKAFKAVGAMTGRFTVGEPFVKEVERVNKNLDSFSGVSLGAEVEMNRECVVCGNFDCGHLASPNIEVGNDKDATKKGNIEFFIEGVPVLELCENGDIKVKGKLIENDAEVVEGLRFFLQNAKPSAFQECPGCGANLVSSLLFYDRKLGEEF